jgi:hypothetical protein
MKTRTRKTKRMKRRMKRKTTTIRTTMADDVGDEDDVLLGAKTKTKTTKMIRINEGGDLQVCSLLMKLALLLF